MALFFWALFFFLLIGCKAQTGFNFGEEKRTQLHFFFHDVVSGATPTAVRIAGAPGRPPLLNAFGDITLTDDFLTEESDSRSKIIGRAQGFYAAASKEEIAFLMAMNLYFLVGNFNGSTLSLFGRNSILSEKREMAIVGGSGYFRLAGGYAIAKTHSFNASGDAIVEYTVYVIHR